MTDIRAVTEDELDRLKAIRLAALADAPAAFGGRLEDEEGRGRGGVIG